jgi:hypothetical protein
MGVDGEASPLAPSDFKVIHLTDHNTDSAFPSCLSQSRPLGTVVEEMRGENLNIGYLGRVIREACLSMQDNLESAVEFLPRPRQQGLSLVARWFRPIPAEMAPSFTGPDNWRP